MTGTRILAAPGMPADVLAGAGAAVLGLVFGGGLVLLVAGLRRTSSDEHTSGGEAGTRFRAVWERVPSMWRSRPRVAAAGLGAAGVGALTGWPVAAALTAVGAVTLPELLGGDRQAAVRTERLEALAAWSEMLRDTLSAAAGLEQTVLATSDIAPQALESELAALAAGLRDGQGLAEALEDFAQAVDDPLADVVVTALVMAARQQGAGLAGLLGELAESVREQVAMRQKIDAGRASIRTGVRVTVGVTLAMAGGLLVFNRPYLDPFDTPTGQAVLAFVGALFTVSFAWLHKTAQLEREPRLLTVASSSVPRPAASVENAAPAGGAW